MIDINTAFGPWPFLKHNCQTISDLQRHLRVNQIDSALVSRLEAIFLPDPHASNLSLLDECRSSQNLSAVPVLNPRLAHCNHFVDTYLTEYDAKAFKLYPSFHHYSLRSKRVSEICQKLTEQNKVLLLNLRSIDERMLPPCLKLRKIPTKDIVTLIEHFSELKVICLGLTFPEIEEISSQTSRLFADMSCADGYELIPSLLQRLPVERLLFGSNTPLMNTHANVFKLEQARLTSTQLQKISHENAKRMFGLT